MRQRMLWIRAGGAVAFLLIAGVVTAHFVTGSTHPMLWNDLDLAPLSVETASVPARTPEHLIDQARRNDNVNVTVNPIAPFSAAAGLSVAAETAAGYGWTYKGPLWGGGRFARLTSTGGGHSGAGGGNGHTGGAGTGSLSRVSSGNSAGALQAAIVHHGGSGGGATVFVITQPITDILFITDLLNPAVLANLGLSALPGDPAGGGSGLSLTPEPGSLMLMATGLFGLFGVAARRSRQI